VHQAGNAMFAWTIARELGLDLDQVAKALEQFSIPGGRGALSQHPGLTVLDDCYNANPQSFSTTISLAQELRKGRRLVFVAGSMRELGEQAPALHAQVAGQLAELAPEVLALVGDFVAAFAPYRAGFAGELVEAADPLELAPRLAERLRPDDLVVLKASRGVALERILPVLVARTAATA
jgi:UDP-N-acetylmuramoyl-tripeptide--D-alanyl-D-alanine ligase